MSAAPAAPAARAWVTGASAGIGAAFAERLAARGFALVLVARRRARLEALAEKLHAEHGRPVEVVVADLTAPAELAEVERRLRADEDVELLVNNAGACRWGSFAERDVDEEERFLRLLSLAPMRLTHAALPAMLARGRGAVVNVSSRAAFTPHPQLAAYSGAKAFLSAFTEALAADVEPRGVRCLAVCPGLTRTELVDLAGLPVDGVAAMRTPEEVVDEALADLDAGERVSVPGEPRRDRWLRRCIPRTALRRGAGILRRLARA